MQMAIAQQEVFAPVMTVMKFETMNEAISIANGTRYGLGASLVIPFPVSVLMWFVGYSGGPRRTVFTSLDE